MPSGSNSNPCAKAPTSRLRGSGVIPWGPPAYESRHGNPRRTRLARRAIPPRAFRFLRLRRRLGAGCHGRPALQLRHSHSDRNLGHHPGAGRCAWNCRATRLRTRRLAGWMVRRSLRPRAYFASGHPLVCRFHLPLRPCPKLRPVVRGPRHHGLGFRRRMGRRRGAPRGSGPPAAPRKSARHHAGRMGRRLGRRRAPLRAFVCAPPARYRLARALPGRHRAGPARILGAPLRRRAARLRGITCPPRRPWRPPSFFEIFRPPLLRVTLLGGLMGTGAQGGYYAVTTWLPTFLRTERKLSVLDSAGYLAVSIAGAFCGYLTGGILADRIGRRLTFLVFAIGAGAVAVTYTMFPFGNN